MNSSIIDKHNKDNNASPNENDNLLEEILTTAMNKCVPIKTIKYNKHKHT